MPKCYGQVKGRKYAAEQPEYVPPELEANPRGRKPSEVPKGYAKTGLPKLDRAFAYPMLVDGVEYESMSKACDELGTETQRFRKVTHDAESGAWKDRKGRVRKWRRLPPRLKNTAGRAVLLDGVLYESVREASRATGATKETISRALNGDGVITGGSCKGLAVSRA